MSWRALPSIVVALWIPAASATTPESAADRFAAHRAVEEVYWRHRIWPGSRRPDIDGASRSARAAAGPVPMKKPRTRRGLFGTDAARDQ